MFALDMADFQDTNQSNTFSAAQFNANHPKTK